MSAEYILSEGNDHVILCERGIRTFEPYTRNTLDLSAIPVIKALTHLPVIIDPSHATGIREKVSPMARAAIAAGADGLMIEVHNDPDRALSDGAQSLYPKQFGRLMRNHFFPDDQFHGPCCGMEPARESRSVSSKAISLRTLTNKRNISFQFAQSMLLGHAIQTNLTPHIKMQHFMN